MAKIPHRVRDATNALTTGLVADALAIESTSQQIRFLLLNFFGGALTSKIHSASLLFPNQTIN
jgi:hypothetical protein